MDPERADLMFPFINMPLGAKILDQGSDDYFLTQFGTLDLKDSAFIDPPGSGTRSFRGDGRVVLPRSRSLHGDFSWAERHNHSHEL